VLSEKNKKEAMQENLRYPGNQDPKVSLSSRRPCNIIVSSTQAASCREKSPKKVNEKKETDKPVDSPRLDHHPIRT